MRETERTASIPQKLFAAAAYSVSSTAIMIINKYLLTEFEFPSFLYVALLQYTISVVVLGVQVRGENMLPRLSLAAAREVFPIPVLFFCNTVSGLGATKKLNMPMFVLLRRFSILMTMGLEVYMLRRSYKRPVKVAVFMMVVGALLAALEDVSMELYGVIYILLNDLCTALQGVLLRKKMDENKLDTNLIMFYSNLCSIPLALASILLKPGELQQLRAYQHWSNPAMHFFLVCSGALGFVINLSYVMCTKYNSPLTTTIVGALKNIFTSYIGMLFRDFNAALLVLVGMNVSVAGSLLYNWAEWIKIKESEKLRVSKVFHEEEPESPRKGSTYV